MPQKRERTIIVGFRENIKFEFPTSLKERVKLEDFLDPEAELDEKLRATDRIIKKRLESIKEKPFFPSMWHENKSGNISVLPYSVTLRAGASHNYLLVNGNRHLSSKELLRFQGFPDNFNVVVKYSALKKQIGNSVPIPMIKAVAVKMLESLEAVKKLK